MKRISLLVVIMSILFSVSNSSYGQEQEAPERILLLREGKQSMRNIVAVEAYLIDDTLEVLVEARMYAEKPKINDVILVGPKLGRLHYKTRETVYATAQEEEPYEITKQDGLIALEKRKKVKEPEGTVTKELFKLKIPTDKIKQGKRYQLWVQVESKTRAGGVPLKFKFDLKDLPELISQ